MVANVPTSQTGHQHPQLHVISRFYFDSYRHVSCQSITTSTWTSMDQKNAKKRHVSHEINHLPWKQRGREKQNSVYLDFFGVQNLVNSRNAPAVRAIGLYRWLTWTIYDTHMMTLTTDLGLSIRVSMFEHVRLVTGTSS